MQTPAETRYTKRGCCRHGHDGKMIVSCTLVTLLLVSITTLKGVTSLIRRMLISTIASIARLSGAPQREDGAVRLRSIWCVLPAVYFNKHRHLNH